MGLNQYDKIVAHEINDLRAAINTELNRRDKHTFTFDNTLKAIKEDDIIPSIWNNLIHPLNEINTNLTDYSEVA